MLVGIVKEDGSGVACLLVVDDMCYSSCAFGIYSNVYRVKLHLHLIRFVADVTHGRVGGGQLGAFGLALVST